MKYCRNIAFKRLVHVCTNSFQKRLLAFLFLICSLSAFVNAAETKVFVKSNQHIKGFGGIVTRPTDGKLLTVGSPNLVRVFDPFTKIWEDSVFTFPNYSFGDDLTIIPDGFATGGFLDGFVYSVVDDNNTIIPANLNTPFSTAFNTGLFAQKFDPNLLGLDPITYRASDDLLYTASSFNPFQIYKLKWQGSRTTTIDVTPLPDQGYGWNGWQFGPNNLLYSPDTINNQIISINVDTNPAQVQVVIPSSMLDPLDIPIALKIDSQGTLYFIGRRTGHVYKWDFISPLPHLLATLDPALDNLCLSLDETKLYVTNDENKIVQVNVITGATKTLFESPIVLPWDVAYDKETKSVYVADFGSLKQFKASNGKIERTLVADTIDSGLAGAGTISGITVEQGPDAKIVITDVTVGNVMVLNKSDLSVHKIFNTQTPPPFNQNTGTAFTQPFSTVRVVSNSVPTGEFYLTATPSISFDNSTTPGKIVKFWENPTVINPFNVENTDFFTGLWAPVKLKIYKGYVYVVEAGDLLNEPSLSPGRISRIALSNPSARQILVDNLKNPQGLDIVDDMMYIVEAGTKRLLKASAIVASEPSPVQTDLDLSNDVIIYEFGPIPILPPGTVAVDDKGKEAFITQSHINNIIRTKL